MAEKRHRVDLAIEGIEAMPDVAAMLETHRRPRVGELGCGRGEAALAIAADFLDALVDGFDTDPSALAEGRRQATEAGLDARVRFHEGGAEGLAGAGRYELILILDPGHPADAPAAVRAALADGGAVLVALGPGTRLDASAAGFTAAEELDVEDEAVRLVALRNT